MLGDRDPDWTIGTRSRACAWIAAISFSVIPASAVAERLAQMKGSIHIAGERQAQRLAGAPEFLVEAHRNLEQARAALQSEQKALDLVRQEEARMRRSAIAKSGSWIEPSDLWNKKELLKQAILRKQQEVDNATRLLRRAEYQARENSESNWTKKHQPSWFGSWWQW